MATTPGMDELAETIARLEARFSAMPSSEANRLMAAYRELCRRLDADLESPRDIALSRGAALMLIRELMTRPSERRS